ncbi:DUF2249 domain-containing protein [bacterium]|nr:DUF2249 domain-containing protein [bacterium]
MAKDWMMEKDSFEVFDIIDARDLAGNFLPMIKEKAAETPPGQGLHIIQSFKPIPLYGVMKKLGFEYETEKIAKGEYHIYFFKME